MPVPCPSNDLLALHVDGGLSSTERDEIAAHLDTCGGCRQLVGVLAAARTRTHPTHAGEEVFPASTWRWKPGLRVGRYEVRGSLGRGGMGEVYEALDLELRRMVAIKVSRSGPEEESRSQRVVAEGRTLASLDHPNVVRVFDAGTHDGAAYIVIERAHGSSLRRWLSASPRSVREVLRLFEGLAQGCGAIHRIGLVHRDIKPDNILISEDGQGLLSDFGLASTSRRGTSGTPGYIAPEVERGDEAIAASDQFAFCVTLDEALRACPRGRLPRWTRAIIERGTREDPQQRFGSMEALARAMRPALSGTRKLLIALAGVAAVGVLVRPTTPAESCSWKHDAWPQTQSDDTAWSRFQQSWTQAAAQACDGQAHPGAHACLQQQRRDAGVLLDAIQSAEAPASPFTGLDPKSCLQPRSTNPAVSSARAQIALATAARIEGRTDDALRFSTQASVLAQATGEPRVVVAALHESGLVALARGQLDTAAEQFEAAHWMALRVDEANVAVDSALGLVDLLTNDSHFEEARRWHHNAVAALERMPESDPQLWAQLELVTSLMHQRLHDFPESVAAARRARDHAKQLDPAPRALLIATEGRLGGALQVSGDAEAAGTHLRRALGWQIELRGEQHPSTARILHDLAMLHLANLHDAEGAIPLLEQEVAIRDRPDAAPDIALAEVLASLAAAYINEQRYEKARHAVKRTVETYATIYPDDHPQLLQTFTLRANLAQAEGSIEEASRWAEEGLLLANRTLGGRAPMTGAMSATAGELALNQGKFELAEERLRTALSIFEEVTGPEHPIVAMTLTALGRAKEGLGKTQEAIASYTRALEIAKQGPKAGTAPPLLGLARTSDDPAEAIRYAELAREADPGRESEVLAVLNGPGGRPRRKPR